MTLVFKASPQGSLQQVQVGPVDVVATVAAANSVWGWMGGLAGIKSTLNLGRSFSKGKKGVSCFADPNLLPISCKILTYSGVAAFRFEDTAEAFGGDPSSQMLGLTLCALAYELKSNSAIELFMTYLAPGLLRQEVGSVEGLREALHTQLNDKIDSILNEGAARGLSDRFYGAISALDLTRLDQNSPRYKGWGKSDGKWAPEWYMLGGFLKWLGSGAEGQYRTRSAAVARLAACLKEVGYYKIARIRCWNGIGVRPAFHGVLLVAGGTSETDSFMDQGPFHRSEFVFVSHYYFATTGAMLLNSLQTKCDTSPEVFQQFFEDIDAEVRSQLTFGWRFNPLSAENIGTSRASVLQAYPQWKRSQYRCSRIAVRLAAFFFPQSAEVIAQFYESIANESVLCIIKQNSKSDPRNEGLRDELIRYRIITASICLSVIGCIAGEGFNSLQHSTTLHLRNSRALESLSEGVDKLATSSLPFTDVVIQIAAIHCAKSPYVRERSLSDEEDRYTAAESSSIIGCRNGAFAVLPELLFSMSCPLSVSMLGLRCVDSFIGNLIVQKDQFIRSLRTGTILQREMNQQIFQTLSQPHSDDDGEAQLALQANDNIFLGPPALRPPDTPLYLNIERPIDCDEPLLGLCGRIKGEVVGNVGIPNILMNLFFSLEASKNNGDPSPGICATHPAPSSSSPQQDTSLRMLNIPASIWGLAPNGKPTGDPHVHTYVPVQGDSAWAIFIVGEYDCRITFGCAFCAAAGAALDPNSDNENNKVVLIGYR